MTSREFPNTAHQMRLWHFREILPYHSYETPRYYAYEVPAAGNLFDL